MILQRSRCSFMGRQYDALGSEIYMTPYGRVVMTSREGEGAEGDVGLRRRVRLDGWPELFPRGNKVHIGLTFSGDHDRFGWWVPLEIHAKGLNRAGPFKVAVEQSSDGKRYVRCRHENLLGVSTILASELYVPQKKYRVIVDFRTGGWLTGSLNSVPFLPTRPPFGYGDAPLYPQIGLYTDEFHGDFSGLFQLDPITVTL